jgi:hypothetical protein
MGLVEKQFLIGKISPPCDEFLANQLIDEFISIERRFIQRDWEPAELDGGQFCEILARILYHIDSGNLNLSKSFDDCKKHLENDAVSHNITPRHTALHLIKVLHTIYKFRSQRGAVHISPTYTPNHMDSKLIIESVRWCLFESLRFFWNGSSNEVAKSIRELLQFDVPCIGLFENIILVQRTDLKIEEEIVVLLHYAGEVGFSRKEIGKYSMGSAPAITSAIQKLKSAKLRQIIQLKNGNYRLTDLGSRRIREELAEKLLLS